jgi:diguanylate cyclase (GGDEF)-like protein
MDKSHGMLDIIAIGLDSGTIEDLKRSLLENKSEVRLSFLSDVDELTLLKRRNVHAVLFFSNRFSKKTSDEIRKIHILMPMASIVLMTPSSDPEGIVKGFRAGLFDFLATPVDPEEMRTIIYRLKIHGAIQTSNWNPERALLHLFSRPESFISSFDVASSLNQYLQLFLTFKKEIIFNLKLENLNSLKKKLKLSDHQAKRIKRFLNDDTGLIFGLRFMKNNFFFLLKRGKEKVSYIVATNYSDFLLKDILSPYLSNILKTTLIILEESKRREAIRVLSLTDEVTGLFNQRKLVEDLNHYIGRYRYEQIGFSLLFIDIDFFKNVNDQYGHVYGGQLLRDISSLLKNLLRSTDLVYRYGGDEFIVILPRTNVEETKKIALRICEFIKEIDFSIDHNKFYRLSLSIGVAHFPTDATNAKSIIDFADKMMYQSKKSGRGKVFYITEVMS